MKHKLLSILLCLAMALSLLPTAALAEETTKGTEDDPYSLNDLSTMTRQQYIDAQTRLGGTMYVNVGDYNYGPNGVLGNGTADNSDRDSTKLNYYGAPGAKSGQYSDAAVGKKIVFVNGSITSNVTGYESIDKIGTSLLLAVPAYTNVTFQNITFNNVMSFNYQLYTSPWSQLGELKFDGCTFNGIIVGAIAAQKLTFNGCTFTDYTNTTKPNSSNPTWIRPAYGNWNKGDNEGQGEGFKSLTKINFTGNTVTSTRPVKFEYISQWDIRSKVTATGNYFDISAQATDEATEIKNVGLYLGAHTDANAFDLVVDNNTKSDNTAALYTIPEGKTSLPAGSTVKDSSGNEIELTNALKWKGNPNDVLTLKTAYAEAAVAGINGVSYDSLAKAINAAGNGDTIKLVKAVELTSTLSITADKKITLDLNGCKISADMNGPHMICNAGNLTITDSSAAKTGEIAKVGDASNYGYVIENHGKMLLDSCKITSTSSVSSAIENGWYTPAQNTSGTNCTMTIQNAEVTSVNAAGGLYTVKNDDYGVMVINGGIFTNGTEGAGAVLNWNNLTIHNGTFTGTSAVRTLKSGTNDYETGRTYIYDGTFNGKIDTLAGYGENIDVNISGGSFSQPVKEEYCADGFIPKDNGNGTYGVKTGTYAAKIGDTKYESLEVAVSNVTADETITLLQDVPAESVITVARTISFKVDTNKSDGSGVYAFAADTNIIKGNNTTLTTAVESNVYTYSFVYTAPSSSGSSGYYVSTPSKTEHGTVTVSPRYADKGDTVTVTVKPDSGYVLGSLTVTDSKGNELTLTDKGNGKYTFVMPAGKVEVKASFAKEIETSPFADVATDAYYYEAVKWAVGKGITTGVGNDLFAPEQPCTRAQIVTFLWRAAGSPEPKGTASGMTDVVSGSYYEKAVAWAIENGVTTGTTTTTFSPDATCTRAQAVTFLARALSAKASGAAEFSDVPADSYFADAVAWAAANGVTEGIGGGLFGSDNDCTRGQIVTFLYRAYNK